MKRIELLAPAGDFESLKAAIANGANAIYLGGNAFSARAFAKNFDRDELEEAVKYAHLRGVKIHVTINILYKDEEFTHLFDYIDFLYKIQVDALLIQDIGLLKAVRARYPDFEVHVSTQMTVNTLEALRYFEELGVKRVVLSRENTIEQMKYICDHTSLEVEVFAHGAICVAYSGQCLMSSMIGKRSGNRGACAQPCRLPYRLEEDGKILDEEQFLMSPRDLCTIENVEEFIKAGITSLKIEGRMKKPEYVAAVVHAYKKAIDHVYDHHLEDIDSDDIDNMKRMFNRHYTKGYAFHDHKIVDQDYSGNRGMHLGYVKGYSKKKKCVSIMLEDTLSQLDSIVFEAIDKGRPVNKIYKDGMLVNEAHKGEVVEIEFNTPVYEGAVNKTVSVKTIEALRKTFMKEGKFRYVSFSFYAYLNSPMMLMAECDGEHFEVISEYTCEKALHTPTDEMRIEKQLRKLGGTIYEVDSVSVDIAEEINIPISILNKMRREMVDKMNEHFSSRVIHHEGIKTYEVNKKENVSGNYYVCVRTLSQLKCALDYFDHVYYYYQSNLDEALDLFDQYEKEAGIYLPRITTDKEIKEIVQSIPATIKHFIVNDYGFYRQYKDKDVILGTGLNIFNHYSASSFDESLIVSYETTSKQIETIKDYAKETIVPIYGYIENMISDHCVISQRYFGKKVPHCSLCKKHSYRLIDRKDVAFSVFTDDACRNHILNAYPLYYSHYRKFNTSYFMMFTIEEDIQDIIESILKGQSLSKYIQTTTGYLS
jgi:putative protease